jgi:Ca-activated chloride channel family protein
MKAFRTNRKGPPPVALLFAVVALVAGVSAQEQEASPRLRIVSPAEGSYVAGSARLVAQIEPASAIGQVATVTFFADGTQACAVPAAPFECDWDAGERIRAHQIRVVAALRDGRRVVQTAMTKALEYVEAVDVDLVQVTAVVTDEHGRFVTGLTEKNFAVTDDGKPQRITNFSAGRTPLELVTAVDVSSSVQPALPGMKKAASRFLAGIESQDRVTVLGFNDNIFTLARRSTDAAARDRAIGRLASWGGTALYDAIVKSVQLLAGQGGRQAIVLFTDGDDQSSHTSIDDALAQVESSDAVIYPVGEGRAVRDKDLQKLLLRLARTSGGRTFVAESADNLDPVFAEILDDLHHQYTLAYPTPHERRDGAWHKVSVNVAGGKYHVRARQGYRLAAKP